MVPACLASILLALGATTPPAATSPGPAPAPLAAAVGRTSPLAHTFSIVARDPATGELGQAAGGDIRGKQSAAQIVVRAKSTGKPWQDRIFDLRVEDHPLPLQELRRLVRLRRACNLEDEGDNFIAANRTVEALDAYERAMKLAPEVVELKFWAAVSMYTNRRADEARTLFREVFAQERRWVELVPRLARAGLFPRDPKVISDVQALGNPAAPW
ncbi:MAG: DUF1028 domain-containing protein [Candidatus Eisenbacteria bacterium]|nr:DUF1028 domain-containing protein [Candidatus Eisenbacteria bacterium]